ncbi:MAG: hypothetical protein BGN86_03675 [Caulobacterales bacterium 68-7]|nr:MAG: hypothetical protein BGN86_03675 [Caulobacterales bacterium 68-7]
MDPPLLYSGQTYRGAGCTDDCSGHEAGYEWAELHGIEDPDDCGGNSYSFIEGCVLYAQERAEEADPSGDEEEDQE